MRDSVPSPRYLPVCNVLHQWKTSLIPTYRVYRLYDKVCNSVSDSVEEQNSDNWAGRKQQVISGNWLVQIC